MRAKERVGESVSARRIKRTSDRACEGERVRAIERVSEKSLVRKTERERERERAREKQYSSSTSAREGK